MLILHKARALDLMISRSEHVLVPEPFTAAYAATAASEDAAEATPSPVAARELALQPTLPYSTTWSVPTIP